MLEFPHLYGWGFLSSGGEKCLTLPRIGRTMVTMTQARGGGGVATFAALLGVVVAVYGAAAVIICIMLDVMEDKWQGRRR